MEHGGGTYRRSEIAVSAAPSHTMNERAMPLLHPTGSCRFVYNCLFLQSDWQGGLHELGQIGVRADSAILRVCTTMPHT